MNNSSSTSPATTYLYLATFSTQKPMQIISQSNISELDAHAKAYAKMSLQQRDECVSITLKTMKKGM